LRFKLWSLKRNIWNLKSKNLKYDKKNQIDIIELYNVVKFENWMSKIENKVSELEILKFELLNIKILKDWKLKTKKWKLEIRKIEN
jgi:hypothetical protein